MTGPHLITTPASAALCPRCRHLILVGIAEGETARVDPTELTPVAEVEAILTGRATYTFTAGAELVIRTAYRITGGLAGVVLAAHACTTTTSDKPPF